MNSPEETPDINSQMLTVPGPKLLTRLVWGCLLFIVVMGLGTFSCAKLMTSFLKKHAPANSQPTSNQKDSPADADDNPV